MFSGGTPNTQNPSYWLGSIPWISPKDFGDFELISAKDNVSALAIAESSSKIVPKDSVVLVVRSGILLHTIPIAVTGVELAINQDIKAIVCRDNVLPRYLVTYFRVFQDRLLPVITKFGATVQSINTAELINLKIPVPSLVQQSEIVATYLNALASAKTKREEASRLLVGIDTYLLSVLGITMPSEPENTIANRIFTTQRRELAGWRFDPLFHKPWHALVNESLMSSKYQKVHIRDICHLPVGGATPTRGDAELYDSDGIKFLRIMNVGKDELVLEDVKFIKPTVHEGELGRSQLKEDDVLLTITGRVGTAAVVTPEVLPANINQHVVRLRLRRDDCLPSYLSAYLNSAIGIFLSNRGVTGGTRIALDYPTIGSLQIPLPPIATQVAILEKITSIRTEAKSLRTEAEVELETAKRHIEAMLLGEVQFQANPRVRY